MQVDRIDQVHIEVRDREAAADWYGSVLGLSRMPELPVWAEDPMGPLILSAADGYPALSMFARGCAPASRDYTIAFRVSGEAFARFLVALPREGLCTASGDLLRAEDLSDHGLSRALYFVDPDGNRLELPTCDPA